MSFMTPTKGAGWASSHIVDAIGAVIAGRYDAVCGNGIIAQAQQDRFIHRDLLALRWSDFEDQPSGGIELAPSKSPSSETDRLYDSGGRRVASCFGGLAIYDSAIFKDDGCTYDFSVKMASGTASTSSSTSAWPQKADL